MKYTHQTRPKSTEQLCNGRICQLVRLQQQRYTERNVGVATWWPMHMANMSQLSLRKSLCQHEAMRLALQLGNTRQRGDGQRIQRLVQTAALLFWRFRIFAEPVQFHIQKGALPLQNSGHGVQGFCLRTLERASGRARGASRYGG